MERQHLVTVKNIYGQYCSIDNMDNNTLLIWFVVWCRPQNRYQSFSNILLKDFITKAKELFQRGVEFCSSIYSLKL